MARSSLILLLVGVMCFKDTLGYSSGAPASDQICETMLPKHGAEPMTTPPPFNIAIDKDSINWGETLEINLVAPEGDHFKGLLAMVKMPGVNNKTYGSWKPTTSGEHEIKTSACFDVPNSAVTHTTSEEKQSITLQWVAPLEAIQGLELQVTFVRAWNEIWRAIPHPQKLTVNKVFAPIETKEGKKETDRQELKSKLKEVYASCETETAFCMGMPSGCVDAFINGTDAVCDALLMWQKENGTIQYTLTGHLENGEGYVAMAFSEDNRMGNDSVAGCYVRDGKPSLQRFFNPMETQGTKISKGGNEGLISQVAEVLDSHVFCHFQQSDHNLGDVINVNLTSPYFIHLAKGNYTRENGLGYHYLGRETSQMKINVADIIQ